VLDVNVTVAAYNHDELSGTVNYAAVYEVVKAEMQVPSKLLEHVVMRIARRLLDEFPLVEQVEICLTKVNPPMGASCKGASVKLCLSRLDESYSNRG
jgi:dihydroneopterin aldolase